ncbi:fat atypical cadherin-related [Holotrichia oblita]|uniref:Fat atypical cadherin-related n=1 Tax=Holotrichia oblita TaxID=644536 RepID=A0ACB9SYJ0_HOLOL|nr:fat atypical cadherin-related [Holotrichia oblita]
MYRLSGKRCEYGKYCSPNPCKHGGVCEEGDEGPLCKCRFFTGDICEFDVDECESSPCQNGGTCINELGSFRCVCPPNTTGPYCGNSLYPPPMIANTFALTIEELIGILVGVMVLVILVLMYIIYRNCRTKRSRQRQNTINNETIRKDQIVLNSTRPHELAEYKRGSKLSNLEVNQRDIPVRSTRPSSYTATSQNENVLHYNSILNNLDSIRSYGSAGDELENVPRDYVRNLNLNNQTGGIGNNCESDKTAWADQMHLAQSFTEKPKIKNDFKISSPVNCDPPNRLYGGRSNTIANHKPIGPPTITTHSTDDDHRSVGSYHWDCSDWARHSQTLPNITEVPGSEIPDSSSFHSNESNESRCHHLPPQMLGQINPDRDIETLNEDLESEFMADSECDQHAASPSLNALDSGNEEFRFTTADTYVRHPNSYLPTHGYNIPSEAEGECLHSPGADSDDVEPYGFPSNRNRRKNCDDDIGSVITTLEERNSLLGGGYGSNSDMSTNLCEIEDSECETEQKPLNYLSGVQQTSV